MRIGALQRARCAIAQPFSGRCTVSSCTAVGTERKSHRKRSPPDRQSTKTTPRQLSLRSKKASALQRERERIANAVEKWDVEELCYGIERAIYPDRWVHPRLSADRQSWLPHHWSLHFAYIVLSLPLRLSVPLSQLEAMKGDVKEYLNTSQRSTHATFWAIRTYIYATRGMLSADNLASELLQDFPLSAVGSVDQRTSFFVAILSARRLERHRKIAEVANERADRLRFLERCWPHAPIIRNGTGHDENLLELEKRRQNVELAARHCLTWASTLLEPAYKIPKSDLMLAILVVSQFADADTIERLRPLFHGPHVTSSPVRQLYRRDYQTALACAKQDPAAAAELASELWAAFRQSGADLRQLTLSNAKDVPDAFRKKPLKHSSTYDEVFDARKNRERTTGVQWDVGVRTETFNWARVVAILVAAGDPRASDVLNNAVAALDWPAINVVFSAYVDAVIRSPTIANLAFLRAQLWQLADVPRIRISLGYSKVLHALPRHESESPEALDIVTQTCQDMLKLADAGRMEVRIIEVLEVADHLIAAVHAEAPTAVGRLRAQSLISKAEQISDHFQRLMEAGKTERMAHENMPHGAHKRLIAALARVGRRSSALHRALTFLQNTPEVEEEIRQGYSIHMPYITWCSMLPMYALGRWVTGQEPPTLRHLAIFASWLLHCGLRPDVWLCAQIRRQLAREGSQQRLEGHEALALARILAIPTSATVYREGCVAAISPLVDEPEVETLLKGIEYDWPITPNQFRNVRPGHRQHGNARDDWIAGRPVKSNRVA